MNDTFVVFISNDYGLSWRDRVGTDSYMHAYRLAAELSEFDTRRIVRVKNIKTDTWLAAFRAGEILSMDPVEPDAWSRGLTDSGREL